MCAENRRPDGVALRFQVCRNKVEPAEPNSGLNLLSKYDCRAALADEPLPNWPEMTLVGRSFPAPGGAEGLAGAGPGPDVAVVGDPSEPEGEGPAADPGEEVALVVTPEVACCDILNASFIHVSWGYQSRFDEVPQPRRGIGFVLVVVGWHLLYY